MNRSLNERSDESGGTLNVRILRKDPNSINQSNQFVSVATVSKETATLYEAYKKGRKTLEEARHELDQLSAVSAITVPFSVYVNVYHNHASVLFLQTDLLNRSSEDVEESRKLAGMNMGLRVFFSRNSFQIINSVPVRRIDLSTDDGQEYKIQMTGAVLKPGHYNMFKCFEIIGISDYDVEWAYLMAAKDWYDLAANNCLSYSKRIIREIHRQVMDVDLDPNELKKLNELYISVPGEGILENVQSRISFFMSPRCQPWIALAFVIGILIYIEVRLQFFERS